MFLLVDLFFLMKRYFFLFLFLCASCRVCPIYMPPDPPASVEWKAKGQTPETIPFVDYWWEVFNDATLNDLERQALENNPNLQLAWDKVAEARATVGITRADLFPQININP